MPGASTQGWSEFQAVLAVRITSRLASCGSTAAPRPAGTGGNTRPPPLLRAVHRMNSPGWELFVRLEKLEHNVPGTIQ